MICRPWPAPRAPTPGDRGLPRADPDHYRVSLPCRARPANNTNQQPNALEFDAPQHTHPSRSACQQLNDTLRSTHPLDIPTSFNEERVALSNWPGDFVPRALDIAPHTRRPEPPHSGTTRAPELPPGAGQSLEDVLDAGLGEHFPVRAWLVRVLVPVEGLPA